MLVQSKVYILFHVILVLYEIQVSTENMITSVTRNNLDIFRVGEEGCKNDQSICTNVAASCQQNDGLCRCDKNDKATHFRNPVIIRSSTSNTRAFGDSYGCMADTWISPIAVEPDHTAAGVCSFKPFQLLKSEPSTTYTTFNHLSYNNFKSCQLYPRSPPGFVKYPNNNTLMKLDWLNDTYVEMNANGNSLHFKWKKPVPELQGTIIKIRFYCQRDKVSGGECFEGKISGTWGRYEPSLTTVTPRTNNETETSKFTSSSTVITTILNESISTVINTISNDNSSTVITTISDDNSSTVITTISNVDKTTIMTKMPTTNSPSNNDLNSGKIAAIIISVIVFIVVIILLWCVCKKRTEKGKTNDDVVPQNNDYCTANPIYESNENMNIGQNTEETLYSSGIFRLMESSVTLYKDFKMHLKISILCDLHTLSVKHILSTVKEN